jgi:arylsulfatase A-like enzyme
MGYADVGYQGDGNIPTPFIDSLSASGVRFGRHYAQSVCTPTRAALMTGRYASSTGLVWPMVPGCPAGLPDGMDTLPRALRRQGYRTAMAGKVSLGNEMHPDSHLVKIIFITKYV